MKDEKVLEVFNRDILSVFPKNISSTISNLHKNDILGLEEIRLRVNRPLMLSIKGKDFYLSKNGNISSMAKGDFIVDKKDIEKTLQLMTDFSIYAVEEEIKQGFISLKGGHRVGVVGRVVYEENKIKTVRNLSGMNIRVAREVKDCSLGLLNRLYEDDIKHTLIISPPGCGKTTLLRDMVRNLSNGNLSINLKSYKVGIVDERSEIAGCFMGIPQKDIGDKTDVLDACPKAQGMIMLLRSMSPDIIAVDEIGSIEDVYAIENAINSGVKVLATIHGKDIEEVYKKVSIKSLIENKCFEKMVLLSRKKGPGTIEKIVNI